MPENKFFVGSMGDDIVFLKPVPLRLSRADALILAAWLAAMADLEGDKFQEILDEVRNT